MAIPLGSEHLPPEQIGEARPLVSPTQASTYIEEALRWLPDAPSERVDSRDNASMLVAANRDSAERDQRARVVVADDNADMRHYVLRLLSDDYHVTAVSDGQQALTACLESPPDLVLTNVMMPRLDGFGLLRALRGDTRTRDIPVIMLSARAGEESRVEGIDAGADDYLIKPFSARELVARVAGHLRMVRIRREAAAALREADRRKDEFLATLAHELRNPLAPIRNSLHLLQLAGDDTSAQEYVVGMMERQVNHMVRLIDDLMEVSRITRGKIELRKEIIELAAIIRAAVETAAPVIESADHQLAISLPPQPMLLAADPVRLTQVISNLLNNAAKCIDKGGQIWLTVWQEGDCVVISVREQRRGYSVADSPPRFRSVHPGRSNVGPLSRRLGYRAGARQKSGANARRQRRSTEWRSRSRERTDRPAATRRIAFSRTPRRRHAGAQSNDGAQRRIVVVDDSRDAADSLSLPDRHQRTRLPRAEQ